MAGYEEGARRRAVRLPRIEDGRVVRFPLSQRIQHAVLLVSMLVLSITGLALWYHNSWFGRLVISIEGGMATRGIIHRVFAIVLIGLCAYHLLYLLFSEEGHAQLMRMKPRAKDFKDAVDTVRFNLGNLEAKPKFDWFDFRQKFQYWGVVLGSAVMVFTGLILWFETQSMAVMPKWVFDLTAVVHGYEGLLIFLVLFLWHMYNVHLSPGRFPMSRTWLSGTISLDELKEHHPLEYERLVGETSESLEARG
jgi:cytochrome b subunit of formate dehydrogenase